MRVIVCGSRDWTNRLAFDVVLYGLWGSRATRDLTLIHGACPTGADALVDEWAGTKVPVERFPAEWEKRGRIAGPLRNQQMLDEGKPDLVVAFVNKPLDESRGTADMVRRARKAGVPVYVVTALIE